MNPLFKLFVTAQIWVYKKTGGRRFNTVMGRPIMLLTTTGRKTGKQRTVPVMHVEDEQGRPLVVGSLGGAPKTPLWFENLRANPDVTYQVGDRVVKARAQVLSDEERAKVWPVLVEKFPPFGEYEKKTTRVIPVAILTPV